MEVHEADRWQRLGRFVEEPVRVGERVLDLGHVCPALEVDDREVRPVERLVGAPATARHLVGAVVERAQDAVARLEVRVDLALVPDVVARRDDVDARSQDRVGGRGREAHPARHVLAVGRHEVDAALLAQLRQDSRPQRGPACRSCRRSSARGTPRAAAARCRWAGCRAGCVRSSFRSIPHSRSHRSRSARVDRRSAAPVHRCTARGADDFRFRTVGRTVLLTRGNASEGGDARAANRPITPADGTATGRPGSARRRRRIRETTS